MNRIDKCKCEKQLAEDIRRIALAKEELVSAYERCLRNLESLGGFTPTSMPPFLANGWADAVRENATFSYALMNSGSISEMIAEISQIRAEVLEKMKH